MAKFIKSAGIRPQTVNASNDAKSVLWAVYDANTGKTAAEVQIEAYGLDLDKQTAKDYGTAAQGKALTAFRAALAAYAAGEKTTGVVIKALCFPNAATEYFATLAAETSLAVAKARKRANDKTAEAAENTLRAVFVSSGASDSMGLGDYLAVLRGIRPEHVTEEATKAAAEALAAHVSKDGGTDAFAEALAALKAAHAASAAAEREAKSAAEDLKLAKAAEVNTNAKFVRALFCNELEAGDKALAEKIITEAAAAAEAKALAARGFKSEKKNAKK